MSGLLLALVSSGAVLSCASCALRSIDAPPPRQEASETEWAAVRRALDAERAAAPRRPWAAVVRVTIRQERLGRTVDGRGALAVAPGQALRMILVGPAGSTMLDAWVTPARWRIDVPVASIVRRGGAEDPADLPVGFLRWVFFRPLEGTLFAGTVRPEVTFVLRDGNAVVQVHEGPCDRGVGTTTTRRVGGRTERLEECRRSRSPSPGDWVRYEDTLGRLIIDLVVESPAHTPPGEAFDDPDGEAASP